MNDDAVKEQAAFNRVFKPRRKATTASALVAASPPKPAETKTHWPQRTMVVTGQSSERGQGFSARCLWLQKYGVWFCVQADRPIAWMATPYCYTINRLPSLTRAGLSYAWLP
jgi:hypothetical protein